MILSANILTLLSAQYAHEIGNSLFYAMLQSWMEMRGFDGAAAFFKAQSEGERSHADSILAYIDDRNEELSLEPVAVPYAKPASYLDAFMAVQERERETTDKIVGIVEQSKIEHDAATFAWFNREGGLVLEQVEEEAIIQTVLDRLASRGTDAATYHDIDVWLKGRA